MNRLTILLSENEWIALRDLAEREYRETAAQAAFIIRRELLRLGLLDDSKGGTVTINEPNGEFRQIN